MPIIYNSIPSDDKMIKHNALGGYLVMQMYCQSGVQKNIVNYLTPEENNNLIDILSKLYEQGYVL